jgi:holo-[acyl-carrier protein] synthase
MKLIGHGVDLVDVRRVREYLEREREDFEPAWFTPEERKAAQQCPDEAAFYAGRCAAKEAVAKALGTGIVGDITPMDIQIRAQESGAPTVILSEGALAVAKRLGVERWSLSISHTQEHAVATAIALQDDD